MGILDAMKDPRRVAFVDSVLNANKHLDWVQRLYDKNAPQIFIQGQQYPSTHFMGDDGNGFVYPTVVRQPNGQLKFLGKFTGLDTNGNPMYNTDEAYNYAKRTGTGLQFKNPQDGSWFAANGYKNGSNVIVGK